MKRVDLKVFIVDLVERATLTERQKIAEQLLAQAKSMTEDLDSIKLESSNLRVQLKANEKERNDLKDSLREVELKVNLQHSSTALEFEIQSLKRQMYENEKINQAKQDEYQAELLKVMSKTDPQIQELKAELSKSRKSESSWQRECQDLVHKLDLEINKNEDLVKRYEDAVLLNKELRRDLSDLRDANQRNSIILLIKLTRINYQILWFCFRDTVLHQKLRHYQIN